MTITGCFESIRKDQYDHDWLLLTGPVWQDVLDCTLETETGDEEEYTRELFNRNIFLAEYYYF